MKMKQIIAVKIEKCVSITVALKIFIHKIVKTKKLNQIANSAEIHGNEYERIIMH